jgi:hypothetical protein
LRLLTVAHLLQRPLAAPPTILTVRRNRTSGLQGEFLAGSDLGRGLTRLGQKHWQHTTHSLVDLMIRTLRLRNNRVIPIRWPTCGCFEASSVLRHLSWGDRYLFVGLWASHCSKLLSEVARHPQAQPPPTTSGRALSRPYHRSFHSDFICNMEGRQAVNSRPVAPRSPSMIETIM